MQRLCLLLLVLAAGCGSPPPPPPDDAFLDAQWMQYDSAARAAWADGNPARAARLYELALARARTADRPAEVARTAYNRGAALLMVNDAAPARAALREASAEWARLREDPSPAWLLEARAARLLGDKAGAVDLADRVLLFGRDGDVMLQAWLIKGELAQEADDRDAARKALSAARKLLRDDPSLRAGVAALEARLALVDGQPGEAALLFDKEAAHLQRAGRWADMAGALLRAGGAYAAADKPDVAALRFFRAARSLQGQGKLLPALHAVQQAVDAAGKAGDSALTADVARMFDEIRKDVERARLEQAPE